MDIGKVAVIGLGYVGLPLAVRAAEAGIHVVGVDLDIARIKQLSAGESYVPDVTSHRFAAVLDAGEPAGSRDASPPRPGRLAVTTDFAEIEQFDVCVITVPTPLRDGAPDLTHIEQAARDIAPYLRPGATVVLESTTYPGTTEEMLRPILEEGSGLRTPGEFHLGYSPERIDPGNGTWRLDNTPKVVSGLDGAALERIVGFYARLVARVVPVASTRTAELTKLLENTFRHVNVALVNELAVFADDLGADVWEAIAAAGTKPFGFMPFHPGPGVGGHCLPIDASYLSWQIKRTAGHSFRFVELANDVNDRMPQYVVQRVALGLNTHRKPVNGVRALLLGLAYKKNVGDVRHSPALAVAAGLHGLGAEVRAVEPYAAPDEVPEYIGLVELTEAELAVADVVIVLADHDAFDFELVARTGRYVFDTRNRCTGPTVECL
jgi:nucleotide sugar dehydrogenase